MKLSLHNVPKTGKLLDDLGFGLLARKNSRRNSPLMQGFTLSEILVVLAIIAILCALVYSYMASHHRGTAVATQTPGGQQAPENPYDLKMLFMIDGMKVYRFFDSGRYIYVVDGRDSKTISNQADHQVEVPTIK